MTSEWRPGPHDLRCGLAVTVLHHCTLHHCTTNSREVALAVRRGHGAGEDVSQHGQGATHRVGLDGRGGAPLAYHQPHGGRCAGRAADVRPQ
eukprot:70613-Pyramimonas_sp.AAC.1